MKSAALSIQLWIVLLTQILREECVFGHEDSHESLIYTNYMLPTYLQQAEHSTEARDHGCFEKWAPMFIWLTEEDAISNIAKNAQGS